MRPHYIAILALWACDSPGSVVHTRLHGQLQTIHVASGSRDLLTTSADGTFALPDVGKFEMYVSCGDGTRDSICVYSGDVNRAEITIDCVRNDAAKTECACLVVDAGGTKRLPMTEKCR